MAPPLKPSTAAFVLARGGPVALQDLEQDAALTHYTGLKARVEAAAERPTLSYEDIIAREA
jgi:hypothetical protein